MNRTKFVIAAMITVTPLLGVDHQVYIEDSSGACQKVDIHQDTPFADVITVIDQELSVADNASDEPVQVNRQMQMNVQMSNRGVLIKAAKKAPVPASNARDYNAALTQENIDDIYYIVKTLGNASLVSIKGQESSLKTAGDRIDRVHPLKFLTSVFTNEELKVAMRNLDGRAWVWKNFISGINESLAEEHALNNLLPFTDDFAAQIGVKTSVFLPQIKAGDWTKFVQGLIKDVPRQGQTNRYDQ